MKQIAKKVALLPYMFVLLNWAAVAGLYQFMRGVDGIWDADASRQRAR
jgi:hypothetical protein